MYKNLKLENGLAVTHKEIFALIVSFAKKYYNSINQYKGDNNVCPKFEGLYDNYFGGYSTHIQLKAKSAFRVPQNLKVEVAAPLLCAGVTVYAPLKRFGRPNNSCAVVGIGGLGHLAVQYACKMGMTVTAFTTSDRVSEIHSLGASFIASSTDKL